MDATGRADALCRSEKFIVVREDTWPMPMH
jgi:hypothetical protein